MVAVYLFKLASWLCYRVPGSISYRLAALGGEIYYWAARQHSRKADYNMMMVLGQSRVNRRVRLIARRSFRNYAKYMVDFLRQSHPAAADHMPYIAQGGWNYFQEELAKGKGLMLVTPHFGNWDGAVNLVTQRNYKLHSVAHDFKPPQLNALIQGTREKLGIKIYSMEGALRGLFTALKRNELVVLLVDSPLNNEGVVVEMFGKPVRFAQGPAVLALRTGASVMMGYIARQPGNTTFYAVWEKPLRYELTGNRERDIEIITQQIAYAIEKLIRRHPDQWYMFRPLWLTVEEVAEYETSQQKKAKKPLDAAARPKQTEGTDQPQAVQKREVALSSAAQAD